VCGAIFLRVFLEFERIKEMKVLFIDNHGGGFADYLEISQSTSVEQFFNDKMAGRKPEDYLIRVNRQPVPRDYVLQEADRITVTPTKIDGGRA